MIVVRKKLVTDEDHQPVAVLIEYEDWLEIERLLGVREEKPDSTDLSRFAGKLKMELPEDPVEYQRRIRDEWP
ncbi:MAG: hypothetical protein H0U31_01285 [Chloroflexia bacterium]|nr:hypothetical protein [Chloroflexia bacterium]MDQ3547436.1 hypothetical protein [Chloroflexota bacterium]